MPARFIRPPLLPKTQKGTIPFQPPAAATAEIEADQISDGLLVIHSTNPKFSTNLINVFFSFGPSTARFLFFFAKKKRKWGVEMDQPPEAASYHSAAQAATETRI
ncbi:MAG: hypothetical protein HFF89_01480 [Oscillibacter sp.]|nr:hypothetical protein [Oscillibacter sp.]